MGKPSRGLLRLTEAPVNPRLATTSRRAAGLHTTLILLAAPKAQAYDTHIGMTTHAPCWLLAWQPRHFGAAWCVKLQANVALASPRGRRPGPFFGVLGLAVCRRGRGGGTVSSCPKSREHGQLRRRSA